MKGTTKIELFDASSNEVVKTIESSNMITNAYRDMVQPIFPSPFNIYSTTTNILQLFGGLLLFNKNLDEDADNYYPPDDALMVGHGGEITYSGSDLSLGSYNNSESGLQEDGSYKFVWDFNANQANGEIASICLTSQKGGIIGWGSDTELESGIYRENNNRAKNAFLIAEPDNGYSYAKYIDLEEGYATLLSYNSLSQIATNKVIKFYKAGLYVKKVSPFNTVNNYIACGKNNTSIEEKTINLTEYLDDIGGYNGIACEGKYMYLMSSNINYGDWYSGEVKKMLRIDLTSFECSVISIENTTENTLLLGGTDKGIANNYFFLTTYDGYVYAINIYDSADTHIVKKSDGSDFKAGGVVIYGNYEDRIVMRANTNNYEQAYFVSTKDFIARKTGGLAYTFVHNGYSYASSQGGMIEVKNSNRVMKAYRNYNNTLFYYPENILMTINNLEEPVTKTSAQSMKVTYVLSPE